MMSATSSQIYPWLDLLGPEEWFEAPLVSGKRIKIELSARAIAMHQFLIGHLALLYQLWGNPGYRANRHVEHGLEADRLVCAGGGQAREVRAGLGAQLRLHAPRRSADGAVDLRLPLSDRSEPRLCRVDHDRRDLVVSAHS